MNDKDKDAFDIWFKASYLQDDLDWVTEAAWEAALVYARQESRNNDSGTFAKLNQENKKLREALEMAIDSASFFQKFADCTKDSWSCRCEFCRDTSKTKNLARAREALKETNDK
jgi:hypothetical protein